MLETAAQWNTVQAEQPDDDALVAAARLDPGAFAALYRRYAARVYRYLYGRCGNTDDAQDLTAQVFLDVLQSLPRYRSQGTFAPWLFAIARRKSIDHLRRSHPQVPLDWLEERLVASTSPEHEAMDREALRRLAELFDRLTPEQQELIRLRFAADLTYAEIGKLLGKKEDTVRVSLNRLLQVLNARWEVNHD